jgi:hypothetical protein
MPARQHAIRWRSRSSTGRRFYRRQRRMHPVGAVYQQQDDVKQGGSIYMILVPIVPFRATSSWSLSHDNQACHQTRPFLHGVGVVSVAVP